MKIFFILTLLLSLSCQPTLESAANSEQEKRKAPDTSSRKAINGFGGNLILVENPQGFVQEWLNPASGKPDIKTSSIAKRGEPFGAFILFAGCLPDKNGVCNAEVDFTVYKPDGSVYAERKGQELWKKQAPPAPNTQLSTANLVMRIRGDDPAGEYKVKANVRDLNRKVAFDLEEKFQVQ